MTKDEVKRFLQQRQKATDEKVKEVMRKNKMKGKNKCSHFGKYNLPPEDAKCYDCPDIQECSKKAGILEE